MVFPVPIRTDPAWYTASVATKRIYCFILRAKTESDTVMARLRHQRHPLMPSSHRQRRCDKSQQFWRCELRECPRVNVWSCRRECRAQRVGSKFDRKAKNESRFLDKAGPETARNTTSPRGRESRNFANAFHRCILDAQGISRVSGTQLNIIYSSLFTINGSMQFEKKEKVKKDNNLTKQEAFEKCWAHSPQRAASRQFTRCR